jgi:hypothetical protein
MKLFKKEDRRLETGDGFPLSTSVLAISMGPVDVVPSSNGVGRHGSNKNHSLFPDEVVRL